ncbi:MAG: hypothetical protein AVDCRST_MAG64-4426 [uncultured Phycisphaerae bacterium]|uniref:Uncharacterized protein n=1 Tax=uncultured Phycisphaerae bacterium TaxID=904963 RepID=A0A6J4QN10_9BACT|nr:MAG: hypothetical protein AVDCRST_MAG64-4426 [uncultured Phycisphaerae bacterium]
MHVHQGLADRQPQPQPAEPPRHRPLALLERVEQPGHGVGLDADAGVGHPHGPPPLLVVLAAQRDPAAGRRELHGVAEQVAAHLLEAGRVRPDVTVLRPQVQGDLDSLLLHLPLVHLQAVPQDGVGVHDLEVQLDLAPADPRQVQQVVDQPRLQLHVAADRPDLAAEFRREVGPRLQVADRRQHRRQRRAEFVAQHGQEVVLRLARRLGLGPGPLLPPQHLVPLLCEPHLLGHVERDPVDAVRTARGIVVVAPDGPDELHAAAVGAHRPVLRVVGHPFPLCPLQRPPGPLPVLGVQAGEEHVDVHVGVGREEEVGLAPGVPLQPPERQLAVIGAQARRLDGQRQPLLRRAERLLGQLLLRNVTEVDRQPAAAAAGVGVEVQPEAQRLVIELEVDRHPLGDRTAVLPLDLGAHRERPHVPVRPADDLLGRRAVQPGRLPVDVGDPPVGVEGDEGVGDAFQDVRGTAGRRTQGVLGPLAVGDVTGEAAGVVEPAALPAHVGADQDVPYRAVLAPQAGLVALQRLAPT